MAVIDNSRGRLPNGLTIQKNRGVGSKGNGTGRIIIMKTQHRLNTNKGFVTRGIFFPAFFFWRDS